MTIWVVKEEINRDKTQEIFQTTFNRWIDGSNSLGYLAEMLSKVYPFEIYFKN